MHMSNKFPKSSRISLVYVVLSMKSLGLDVIHFRILTIFRLYVFQLFGSENQSGQLHFTAGSCVSERAYMQKKQPALKRLLSQSDCLIFTAKNKEIYIPV